MVIVNHCSPPPAFFFFFRKISAKYLTLNSHGLSDILSMIKWYLLKKVAHSSCSLSYLISTFVLHNCSSLCTHDPDNNDRVINHTHLEPDILECEVKWALGSITMNKASRGDGIPVELFQILKDDAVKVLHSICQQIWKTHQWPLDWKRSVFIPIPKKGNAKECSNYCTIALISHASKVKVKSLSHARLLATPWTAAYQAPPSMGFSSQEYWSGVLVK